MTHTTLHLAQVNVGRARGQPTDPVTAEMERMDFDLDLSMDVLRRTPAVLGDLLGGLAEPWIRGTEGAETFSPFDVVGHLIDGEETDWIPRARIILARGADPRFEPYDRFRHRARNVGRSLSSLLAEFTQLRAANLELLRSWKLTATELDLPGVHPSLGRVTLRQLLATWVVHDLGHLAQVARVMAKQYRAAVGPWMSFVPVLTDHEVPRS
jgi:DinB family protein